VRRLDGRAKKTGEQSPVAGCPRQQVLMNGNPRWSFPRSCLFDLPVRDTGISTSGPWPTYHRPGDMQDDDDIFDLSTPPSHEVQKLMQIEANDGGSARSARILGMPTESFHNGNARLPSHKPAGRPKVASRSVEAKKEAMLPLPGRRPRFLSQISRNEGHFPGYLPSHP
jgi:hypothetical protein